jgi:exopolysaccharide biosynthesis polyprenyl glycosylphosphotransferase
MNSRAVTLVVVEVWVLVALSGGAAWLWAGPAAFDFVLAGQLGFAILCLVVSFYYNDLYDFRAVRNFSEFSARLPRALGMIFVLTALCVDLLPHVAGGVERLSAVFWSQLAIVGMVLPLRGSLYAVLQTQTFAERVLILGTGPFAWKIAEEIAAATPLSYAIAGFVADEEIPVRSSSLAFPVFGSLEQLDLIVSEIRPDRIVVALSERRGRLPVRVLLTARMGGIQVEDGIEVHERLTGKLAIESLTPSFLIFSKDFNKSRVQMALRRVVSLATAALGLLMFTPVMALIALAIKLDSPGSIFFVQNRAGVGGRSFGLVKFRTMHPAADETSAWVQDNMDRITRVGKWLRRFRLDELPQFFNVLRGDMNLVGPRPHPISNYNLFMATIPYYSLRSVVRPGMTGWAQVCYAYANSLEEETEKMRYDLFYIKHLSLWLDLRIIVDTVKIILFGHAKGVHEESPETSVISTRPERHSPALTALAQDSLAKVMKPAKGNTREQLDRAGGVRRSV